MVVGNDKNEKNFALFYTRLESVRKKYNLTLNYSQEAKKYRLKKNSS